MSAAASTSWSSADILMPGSTRLPWCLDEAALVVERDNRRIASEAIALRSAMLTAWPGGEEATKLFNDLLRRLNGD
ncbi:hypothetical protein [Sphingomonas hankookensis]|uniref:hypothetical protein n=1 Tax=Sphingomonas hankookensis TaxID=563996 RepID=UPI003D3018E8